jgi:hypothetical protein
VTLFDELIRKETGSRGYAQPSYDFLNQSAWPECAQIRSLLESWFSEYPEPGRAELLTRFRSQTDREHHSAFFELFLYHLLSMTAGTIEIHPEIEGTQKRPDFAVTSPVQRVFVEATTVEEDLPHDPRAERRRQRVLDALSGIKSPDFRLHLEESGVPRSDPRQIRVQHSIREWLNTLRWEDVVSEVQREGLDSAPTREFDFEGYHLRIWAIPKGPGLRNLEGESAIGSSMPQAARWMRNGERIRKAITGKASRYGRLQDPYIIAINALDFFVNSETIFEALFGQEIVQVRTFADGSTKTINTRDFDGAWLYKGRPIYTRVSGILVFTRLHPWNVHKASVALYHNPWAECPYSGSLTELSTFSLEGDSYLRKEGKTVGDLLSIKSDWLEGGIREDENGTG